MNIITNHADQAVGRLLEQFRGSTRLRDLIRILIGPIQDLENVFSDLAELRALDSAFGAQLDGLGEIVDQARGGMSDEDYLTWLKLRIFINVSKARPEDLIYVLKVITEANQVRYFENHPASVELFTDGLSIPEVDQVKQYILGLDDGGTLALDDGGSLLVWSQKSRTAPFLVRLMEGLAAGGVGPCPVVISLGELPLAFGADPDMGLLALDDGGEFQTDDGGGMLMVSTNTLTGTYGEGGYLTEIGPFSPEDDESITGPDSIEQTVSGAHVSLEDETALVWIDGQDLSPYEHYYAIVLIDSADKTATGYAGAPGTLLTLDSNLLSNPTFNENASGWTAWDVVKSSVSGGYSGNCLKIESTGTNPHSLMVYQYPSADNGGLYFAGGYQKSGTSVGELEIYSGADDLIYNLPLDNPDWAPFEAYVNAVDDAFYFCLTNIGTTPTYSFWDEIFFGKVLTAPPTGLDIFQADGTRGWQEIQDGFDPRNVVKCKAISLYHGSGRFTEVLQ